MGTHGSHGAQDATDTEDDTEAAMDEEMETMDAQGDQDAAEETTEETTEDTTEDTTEETTEEEAVVDDTYGHAHDKPRIHNYGYGKSPLIHPNPHVHIPTAPANRMEVNDYLKNHPFAKQITDDDFGKF